MTVSELLYIAVYLNIGEHISTYMYFDITTYFSVIFL